jgi:hypothetical protein
VMSPRIAPRAICKLAESCGLAVEMRAVSRGTRWRRRGFIAQQAIEWALQGLAFGLRVVTLGRYRGELAETRLVFRKIGPAS